MLIELYDSLRECLSAVDREAQAEAQRKATGLPKVKRWQHRLERANVAIEKARALLANVE